MRKLISSALLLLSAIAHGAPCCGSGSAIPSLITGDDAVQISASLSRATVIGDAPPSGLPVFRSDGDSEVADTFRLDGAMRLGDRFQAGAGVPLVRRARTLHHNNEKPPEAPPVSDSSYGLGDVTLTAGYEALPEWTYSPWKPRGFVFIQSTLPTSPSTYDAENTLQLDARGRGFFQLGVGAAFLKTRGNWDFIATVEAHRSFPRAFDSSQAGRLELTPGWGAAALLGAGYSPAGGALRLGLSLSPVYEGPIHARGDVTSRSEDQLVWNTSALAGYALSPEWSAALIYTDQTLLGPARNVSLSRSGALSAQRRFPL